jgi:hypothetical protein
MILQRYNEQRIKYSAYEFEDAGLPAEIMYLEDFKEGLSESLDINDVPEILYWKRVVTSQIRGINYAEYNNL